jgi:hypothetical protein
MEILLTYNVPHNTTIHTECVTTARVLVEGNFSKRCRKNVLINCGVRNNRPRLVLLLLIENVPDSRR